jgi:hypothetical protein
MPAILYEGAALVGSYATKTIDREVCTMATKTFLNLLSEGRPFCVLCGKQAEAKECPDPDVEESHLENCPHRRKLTLQRQLRESGADQNLIQNACDHVDMLSAYDLQAIFAELAGLGNQPGEIIKKVDAFWARA